MNDAPPPTIGAMELPDPRGPITEDFKRGACYVARLANREFENIDQATITIMVTGGQFDCPK